ncbi:SDR family NAD(P)-dependent oxidoreductase [uncultured Gammaproteobacteria bacterium]
MLCDPGAAVTPYFGLCFGMKIPISQRPNRLFCFGLGYSAGVLARALLAEGWAVAGTHHMPLAEDAAQAGVDSHHFERAHPLPCPMAALAGTSHVLLSIPPDDAGDPVLDRHGTDLAALAGLCWIGYLSTTGVYGDHGGAWVDETTPTKPSGPRQRRRVLAEQAWLEWGRSHGVAVQVFRLAGIYGPGRNVLDQLRAGTAKRIDQPGQIFSRIHVNDIAAVLRASIARPSPDTTYNVCDDLPAPAEAVVNYAAGLLGMGPPPLVPLAESGLSPMALSFHADNKRVRNERIKRELGVVLRHPDYKSGLAAILAAETA